MEDLAMLRNLLLPALLLAAAPLATAQDLGKMLHDRYHALDAAIVKRDTAAVRTWVGRYCSPDFTYTSKDKRKYGRKAFLDGLVQMVSTTRKVVRSDQHAGKPLVKGTTLDVKVASSFEGFVMFDKRELRLVDKSETIDRWVLSAGAWKLKSSVQTRADTQVYQK
jgi:hypothetical protein